MMQLTSIHLSYKSPVDAPVLEVVQLRVASPLIFRRELC